MVRTNQKWSGIKKTPEDTYNHSGYVLSHTRTLAHTRMGYPIRVYLYGHPVRVWAAHTRTGWAYYTFYLCVILACSLDSTL